MGDSDEEYMARVEEYYRPKLSSIRRDPVPETRRTISELRLNSQERRNADVLPSDVENQTRNFINPAGLFTNNVIQQQYRDTQLAITVREGSQVVTAAGTVRMQQPLTRNKRPERNAELPRPLNHGSVSHPITSHLPQVTRDQAILTVTANRAVRNPPSDRIPHRPAHRPQRTQVQQVPVASRVDRIQNNREVPMASQIRNDANVERQEQRNREQALPVTDGDSFLETNQRQRIQPITVNVQPLVYCAPPVDQSTWVEESQINQHQISSNNFELDPNEPIIASSADPLDLTILPINETGQEYPEMFANEIGQWAQEDAAKSRTVEERQRYLVEELAGLARNSQQSSNMPLSTHSTTSDIPSRPSTAMSRQLLLPPLTKGKMPYPEKRNVPPVSSANIRTNHHSEEDAIDLVKLTTEDCEQMTEEELKQVVNSFYESNPRLKFKETYPFMAEGMVQKDYEHNVLKVFSSRTGQISIPDRRPSDRKCADYVYLVIIKQGDYRGFWFDTHPTCLVSAKFPKTEKIVVRGYAILAHPIGSRDESVRENRWVCWNDSLGLLSIISGAARTPIKKQPVWDKQLDIISIHADFEHGRFVVTKVVGLTNFTEKLKHFPEEVFLIKDASFKKIIDEDMVFHSPTIDGYIFIKKTLMGEVNIPEKGSFEMVVVPSFPKSTRFEFRSILFIHMPVTFWSKDKEWIREILIKRTDAWRCPT